MTATDVTWLRHEPATAAVRLVLLPHAGAGAASFNRWLTLFGDGIALVRVQLPGREDLAALPPVSTMDEAVDRLLPQVLELDGPVALYGHSMGALVGYELAHALRSAGRPPLHLFVSGRRAPHLATRGEPLHSMSDDTLTATLRELGTTAATTRSPALLRHALPLIRADLQVSERYEYQPRPALPCPIAVFHGTEDPAVRLAEAHAWQHHTATDFSLRLFPGDHLFHLQHRVPIAAAITEQVAGR